MKVTLRRCNVFTRYHRCSYLELSDCTPVLFLMARDASLLVATCHRVSVYLLQRRCINVFSRAMT